MKRISWKNINTPEYFDKIYSKMEIDLSVDEERQSVLKRDFKGGKFLDLGCGILGLPFLVKREHHEAEVWGLDFSSETIKRLKVKCPEINYICADCINTPFKDDYFDYIVAGELMEHLEKPEEFVKEVFRILKTEGIFVSSVPCEENASGDVYDPQHIWGYTEKDIQELIEPYGEVETFIFTKEHTPKIIAFCKKYGSNKTS